MTDVALVIFDCDGVLIDSELISAQVLLEELACIGVKIDLPYFFQHCLGRHFAVVAERIARDTGHAIGAEFERLYWKRLLEKFKSELRPVAGAREVLERLPISFCVATSSSTERAARSLDLAGFSDLIDGRLVSTSMVARGKPWPDLFLLAAERHGVSASECLVIEDSEMGIQAARAAKMPVWRFTGGSHFRAGSRWMMDRSPADKEFDDMADFFRLLNS
jgi:HAD superfamily hydrolase (TIGR01509 family)